MSDEPQSRAERIALLALCISVATASEQYRRSKWKRDLKGALWPLL